MEFCVTKSNGSLVPPSGPTPSGMLDLSRIDRLPVLRCNARTLHVFQASDAPDEAATSTIRDALSKALVPYYPLAGRLTQHHPPLDQLQVDCSKEGVWFVEASATCSLESVGYFEDITSIPFDKLLPHHPPKNQGLDPLVLMQVTEFKGDGFVMGLTFCHTICDGLGAAQFLNAIGEFARGVKHLKVTPVWQRDFLDHSQCIPPGINPSTSSLLANMVLLDYQLEQANIDIPLDHINQLKQKFLGHRCSTFEIVAAILWKSRTQAIVGVGGGSMMMMKLVFFANCRQLVDPPLPEGFYGNCFFPVTISASSDTLAQSSTIEVVKMIQEAKARLPKEFADWVNSNNKQQVIGENKEDPFAPPLGYTTLFISEWGRLGFNQVDYGKGPPLHVVPVQGSSIIPAAIVGTLPRPNKGIRLMTWCLQKHHIQPLLHAITTELYN